MNCARIPMLPLLAFLASATAWPALAADQSGGTVPAVVSGAYSVTFNVNVATALPAGATITCRAQIVPNQPPFENAARPMIPVRAASGVVGVIGSKATCAVEIPFSWTVNNARSGVALSYEIDAVGGYGSLPVQVRSQQGIGASYPALGTTANLVFNVTI